MSACQKCGGTGWRVSNWARGLSYRCQDCAGSLPDELSGRGGTSERSTNKPAHSDGVHNTPHPKSCACMGCCAMRAEGAIDAAMQKWRDDERKLR